MRAFWARKHIHSGGRARGSMARCMVGAWSSSLNCTVPQYHDVDEWNMRWQLERAREGV